MRYSRLVLATVIGAFALAVAGRGADTAPSKDPGAAMILSTGDNLFYYKWFPIDSPAGIAASFDIFKSHYNVDRIIWRGAQAQWMMRDSHFPEYPEEMHDIYMMEMNLELDHQLSRKAQPLARERGLAYWGYMPLFDVGQGDDAVCMGGFGPYNFNEKYRAEHPEYCLYDRARVGIGSTLEWGYPEVRKEWLGRYEDNFKEGGEFSVYEGIIFYTYVENFYPRYTDQYMFSDLAVKDFKAKYGVDVLTQDFDHEKYQAMRGEYITQYLREMKQLFNKYNKKLAFYIDAKEPDIAMRWPSYPGILVPGTIKMDWRTWIKEGLVDEIALRSATDIKYIQPFLDAAEGTKVRINVLSNQLPPNLTYLYDKGVTRHIWAPELASDFPKMKAPVSALDGSDRIALMSVLRQVRDGELEVPVAKLTALFHHDDLMVRRQAVAAVLARRMVEAIPALEEAAMDPEMSFRAMVLDALGTLHGPNTVTTIGKALAKYPVFEMRLVARTAWSAMFSERPDEIIKLYRDTDSPYVKLTIMEMPIAKRALPQVDAIPAFRPIVNEAAKDADDKVRFTAAFTTAYYPDKESAELLLKMLDDKVEAVQDGAAFSLGEVARRIDDRNLREQIFSKLVERQKQFGEGSTRGDVSWGFRPVDEAIMYGFGPRGERQMVSLLNGSDKKLAVQAWNILFHPNDGWNFYDIEPAKGEALYAYYPGEIRTKLEKKPYILPPQAELISQSFAGITADPTGVVGDIWSTGGKWTGLDPNVRFGDAGGKPYMELGVGKNGKGARVVANHAYDIADGRFKNRLRGHFPASPTAYGLADGKVDLSIDVRKSEKADAVQVVLAGDAKSKDVVGFRVNGDGTLQVVSNATDAATAGATRIPSGAATRVSLQLDFSTGQGELLSGGKSVQQFKFDNGRQYRAVVLSAVGDPETSSQLGDLKLTHSVTP